MTYKIPQELEYKEKIIFELAKYRQTKANLLNSIPFQPVKT